MTKERAGYRLDLLEAACCDGRLSTRAMGLLLLLVRVGYPMSADEVWEAKLLPEGRDAIRRMMQELKACGYVVCTRQYDRVRKQFYTLQDFPQEAPVVPQDEYIGAAMKPAAQGIDAGNPGVTYLLTTSTRTELGKGSKDPFSQRGAREGLEEPQEDDTISVPTSTLTHGWDAAHHAMEVRYRTPTAPQGRKPRPGKTRKPRTTTTEHVPVPRKESPVLREPDAGLGDDIDVADPLAKTPPRKTKVRLVHTTDLRHTKTHDRWTSFDLCAEFNSHAYQAGAGDVPYQISSQNLGGALGRLIRNGSSPAALAKCIDLFFGDPRNLRDMGTGLPLWHRFLADITHTYGKAQKIINHDTIMDNEHYAEDVAWAAEQTAQMPAILADSRRREEAREKSAAEGAAADDVARQKRDEGIVRVREEMLAYRAKTAQIEAERLSTKQAEFLRLRAESEARQAEHPDEEWIVEDEEEWIPEDDEAVVAS